MGTSHALLTDPTTSGRCDSCEVLSINGCRCHELGCPDAWKDDRRSCKWCGSAFTPETRYQVLCSEDCAESYNG